MDAVLLSRLSVSAFAIGFAALGSASTSRADKSAQLYRDLANQATFASVGIVGGGTGTLISSQWMITAAHVIGSPGANFNVGGSNYGIDQVYQYPGWGLGQNDIALCHLSTAVSGITPAKLWSGGNEVGKIGTSVGYGTTGTGLTGNNGGRERRAFTNVIDAYNLETINDPEDPFLPGLISDFDSPAGDWNTINGIGGTSSATALDLEGCVAPGDSGGSLWMNFDGQDYVVGITSYVFWADNRPHPPYGFYGDGSGYSRVTDAADWIYARSGVQPVPEPASFAALGLGAAALLRRRRRS